MELLPDHTWHIDRDSVERVPCTFPEQSAGGRQTELLVSVNVSNVKESELMSTPDVKKMISCTLCRKQNEHSMLCSKCLLVNYCDKKCQRADWKLRHKEACCKPVVQDEVDKETKTRRLGLFMHEVEKRGFFVPYVTTIEEVDLNLLIVRAGCKLTNNTPEEERYLKEMSVCGATSPFALKYNDIAVQPSPVHGDGVFATKPLPANVIVTYYPCHAIHNNDTTALVVYPEEDGMDLSVNDPNIIEIVNAYKFQICPEKHLCVVGNPVRRSNPLLLGHLINDSSDVFAGVSALRLNKNKALARRLIMQYLTESAAKRNCCYTPNANRTVLSMVTTRAIEAGEELFATYSPMYWLQNHYGHDFDKKYPTIKKACDEVTVELFNEMKFFQ